MKKKLAKLPPTYDAQAVEQNIYSQWEKGGYFLPKRRRVVKTKKPFVISLPPPNATAALHLGGALMLAVEDLMIRYHRLRGEETLWLPGTDHAAIATQNVVEKNILKEEGKTRHDLGRAEFLKRVESFVAETREVIRNQMRRVGASVDWSRERYTLDPGLSRTVKIVFKMMYDDGLIYRGNRIVNWCPRCQSTLADDEVEYKTAKEKLYWIKYGPFTLATTRPETKLGDTAVAVHPDDARYKHHIGKRYQIPGVLGPFEVVVVADRTVDPKFGSGVIKVTPAHDFVDFEIAQRHGVSMRQVIGEDGRMMPNTGKYAGFTTAECRVKIVEDMQKLGLIEKIEDYEHNLSICYRCDAVIEPLPKLQWFVAVDKPFTLSQNTLDHWGRGDKVTLKQLMTYAVRSKKINIIPDRFEKTYFHWIDNLRDWCISRQIWFGHRIPVYYCKLVNPKSQIPNPKCREPIVSTEVVEKCPHCNGEVEQDPDTLDTWFSSGLWTFSTLLNQQKTADTLLAWAKISPDLKKFHPTSVLETGYDIIFFWVARMILMTTYALGEIPFHTVYLHGLVRDRQGRKMSKSLGNGIDPVDMIAKYGADAVRLSLIIGLTPGNDTRMYEEKIAGYRNFTNKLWNISRFILTSTKPTRAKPTPRTLADRWIMAEFNELKIRATNHLDNYRFSQAGEELYEFTWAKLADWYLEISKIENGKDAILRNILDELLTLWHPFAPFVSEHIWSLAHENKKSLLIINPWPQGKKIKIGKIQKEFSVIQSIVSMIRDLRQETNAKTISNVEIVSAKFAKLIKREQRVVETLSRSNLLFVKRTTMTSAVKRVLPGINIYMIKIQSTDNAQKLEAEKKQLSDYITQLKTRLDNQQFLAGAPATVVAKEKERLKEAEEKLKHL